MYTIQDWAGNTKFNGKTFNGPDQAEIFLRNTLLTNNEEKYETMRGEFKVIELLNEKD